MLLAGGAAAIGLAARQQGSRAVKQSPARRPFILDTLRAVKQRPARRPSILDTLAAIPDDGNLIVIRNGVLAMRRDDSTVFVSVDSEYEDSDPNYGYADGSPAALLSAEIPASRIVDAGFDGNGFEWWIVRA